MNRLKDTRKRVAKEVKNAVLLHPPALEFAKTNSFAPAVPPPPDKPNPHSEKPEPARAGDTPGYERVRRKHAPAAEDIRPVMLTAAQNVAQSIPLIVN